MADGPEEHLGLDLLQDLHSKLLHDWFCCRKENIMVYSHAKSTACIHALLSCRCKRRIAPKGSIRLVGCRSCTPRPKCALSCAQVMRRAAVRSVKTICRYQHLNHWRISRHKLISLSRSPLSWTSPPFYFATGQAKSIASAARLTTKWLLVLYPLINNTNTK